MAADNDLPYQKTIQVSIDFVYRAFTSSTVLREWLCDFCTTNPVVGGRIFLAWSEGILPVVSLRGLTNSILLPSTGLVSKNPIGRASQSN